MLFFNNSFCFLLLVFLFGCNSNKTSLKQWNPYDETVELELNSNHLIKRLQFKRIQSNFNDKNNWFIPFKEELTSFTLEDHDRLKPFILEQDIPSIQNHIKQGNLTYETLTLFYLFRIYYFEIQQGTYLNSIISLNPKVLDQAREKDSNKNQDLDNPVYGMPILLKDNINSLSMATTAGAAVFQNNISQKDAFIVGQLKAKGALILGKANMSEWAYYFCQECPVGYSAMGGQTLNPYGRKEFETGGSSSGSGVAVAANFAVAAIGSETSGSILSPSAKNSIVGLKPTIGSLSRSGIIPISSTLDTAGPMTKFVIDNAILLNALIGKDEIDPYSYKSIPIKLEVLNNFNLKGKRLGLIRRFQSDSLMQIAIIKMENAGAKIIYYDPPNIELKKFRKLLDVDMKVDLPSYIKNYGNTKLDVYSVKDIVDFNLKDTLLYAPYGQGIFDRIAKDTISRIYFKPHKNKLMSAATKYFQVAIRNHHLDAILSIDNFTASFAAAAHYPAIGVPMGYLKNGQPQNITFIAPSRQEQLLFELAAAFEKITKHRKTPKLFK